MGKYLKEANCVCDKRTLMYKSVYDAYPYGGNFEWEECSICKEKHNFRRIKRKGELCQKKL